MSDPAPHQPAANAAASLAADWFICTLTRDANVRALADALSAGRRVAASGAAGSSTALVAGATATLTKRTVLLVVAHLDDAEEALDELIASGVNAIRLPALESLPGESGASLELFAERLGVQRRVLAGLEPATVVVAPISALMQSVPAPAAMDRLSRVLRVGEDVPPAELGRWLDAAGYSRVDTVEEPGDFATRGGIMDIFPPAGSGEEAANASAGGVPVRLEFFGDTIERIAEVDLETMGSDRQVQSVALVAADAATAVSDAGVPFVSLLPSGFVAVLAETMELVEQARGYFERVTDSKGIYGPPATLAAIQHHAHAMAEINAFSVAAAAADARVELDIGTLQAFSRDAGEAVKELAAMVRPGENARAGDGARGGERVVVFCQNEGERQRLGELLAEFAPGAAGSNGHSCGVESVDGYLHLGFVYRGRDQSGVEHTIALVPYHELLNRFTVRRRAGKMRATRAIDTFLDFKVGDHVVHQDHGIALFTGLTLMKPRPLPGSEHALKKREGKAREQELEEYLTLEFAGRAKLHVPAMQIDLVQKYVGGFSGKPPLSTLGGQKWKNQKERTAESVKDLAAELLRVRAAREHIPGTSFPGDTTWQKEFEAEFPYTETEDQLSALAAIKQDMGKPRPMDRLICGDVGFGKTELAIRAAFKACEFGKQVAVLVPTTVLAEQHERTFRSRFAGYPFRVESLSRFKTTKEQNDTLAALRKGQVDLVIGTHRLLSQDVKFADLGLVVIDEEQRFGVEHKEQLLRLRMTVDVLTLSATPIPRTLHMAMLGIRDISSLTTPPLDRRAIVTEVIPYNERRVAQAIARELSRDGQVFYVHNRVHDILSVADQVQKLAPEARIVVGHGQMEGHELEEVMLKFMRRQADILVSTTIIESGIDIASANTMIIDNADRFGLAELHQLRGRVGRSKHRAYCYLLLPDDRTVREIAQKRLKAIEQYSMLGAGFKIAMRDLEIRGAGNILGAEQSGHIAAVGYEMYCQLLETAVHDLKHERPPAPPSKTSVEIGVGGVIPKAYIPSEQRRLEAYRRLATAATSQQLDQFRDDLKQAYGDPPRPTQRLIELAELRIACAALGVRTVTIREKDVIFITTQAKATADALGRTPANVSKAIEATIRVLAPKETHAMAEVYFRPPEKYLEPDTLLSVLRKRLAG
ncbi:MAG: transcription-repair coupling factor [Planctomycetota bacterium]|nr:transcription-repair coupling factor [Planctomycetota bacterium]